MKRPMTVPIAQRIDRLIERRGYRAMDRQIHAAFPGMVNVITMIREAREYAAQRRAVARRRIEELGYDVDAAERIAIRGEE